MPDLIAPSFGKEIQTPVIQAPLNTGNKPANNVPDIFNYISPAFAGMQDISLNDFSAIINNGTISSEDKQKRDTQNILNSLGGGLEKGKDEPSFRYFKSADAMRYKQNDRLWNTYGFNPETPDDITDAVYDFHETTWESFKNVIPKLWNTTKFAYGNYFAEYYDAARAIGKLDANLLHDANRFTEYNERQREMDALYPDYKTDKEVKWWQLTRGDFWEESGSSLGFTIGTIGAALTENIAISLATGGLGELGELYNTPRKIFKAISEYYSLKRAYSLTKAAVGGNASILGRIASGAQLWRLTNGALSEAAFEGATNAWEYMNAFEEKFIRENGRKPTEDEKSGAKAAANEMANATILFQTPFLMASNAVQFGNIMAPKSFPRLLTDVLGKKTMANLGQQSASKLANVGGKTVVAGSEEVAQNLFARYGKKALKILRNPLWEGTEESYQALVTTATQKYYGDKYLTGDDASLQASLGAGWNYVTSNEGMKEFAAGFATGSIFKIAGLPIHHFAKPKVRTEEEQKTYKKENPQASDIDAKYKTNFLNSALGFGMNKINQEREAANLQKMADSLNAVDLDKFLKEEGFLSLLKDKQTSFALAKYLKNNDQFNMQNTQNLQLIRFLYAGLATGKIDLQVDKLKSFADQDFDTLKNFFDLDENDYASAEEKDQFVKNLRAWTSELDKKAGQFEKIYDKQKASFKPVLEEAAKENSDAVNAQNEYVLELKKKYNVDNVDELNKVVTPVEKSIHNKLNEAAIASHTRYYAVNEAIKASIFSQVGMDDAAQRARDVVSQLMDNNTTNSYYHELGDFFDIGYREGRLKDLEGKVQSAKSTSDPNVEIYEQQLNNFKKLTKILDNQFNKGSAYKEGAVADAIQEYLVAVQREINQLDNSTDLETRIRNEMSGQFDLLTQFVKLQRKHQENLNLWNYLTSQANREDYINYQSNAIKEFFSQAIDLNEKEKVPEPVVEETTEAAQPAQAVAALPPVTSTPTTTVEEAEVVDDKEEQAKNIRKFLLAIAGKKFQEVADMREMILTYPKDYVLERANIMLAKLSPTAVAAIKEELTSLFGDNFFTQAPATTPPVVETPVVEEPTSQPTETTSDTAEEPVVEEPEVPQATGLLAEILATPGLTAVEKGNDLQYFIDKAGENPIWAEKTFGKKIADQLIAQVSTDQLRENFNFVARVDETSPVAVKLDEILGEREEAEDAPAEEEERVEEPLEEIDETPPPTDTGESLSAVAGPLGVNYISQLIDDAREGITSVNGRKVKGDGYFVFDAQNPEEIDKIEDDLMVLKSASDPMALKHHRIMEMLDKVFAKDDNEKDNFKVKLEKLSKDNEKWFYQAKAKSGNMLAMLVDSNGDYHYFDEQGRLTSKENGEPFGVEYNYRFYREEELSLSRNTMSPRNAGQTITPNYGENASPLSTIYSLLASKIPVYGSILGVTSGTLSRFGNNNTFNNEMTGTPPKMRQLKELFDSGELDRDEMVYVKVRGFLINYAGTDQRVKVGRPMIVDRETGLNIPLTGRKLKNITFNGTPISKNSQMYEVIDFINKNGYLDMDSLRPDKTRIVENADDVESIYNFLREVLYSKFFTFHMPTSTRVVMTRNTINAIDGTDKAANSLWEAEINYVDSKGPVIGIPFTVSDTEDAGLMDYEDFLAENFETGAIKAVIEKNDVRFSKINKRVIFKLDDTHAVMERKISQSVNKSVPEEESTEEEISIGDLFYLEDPTRIEEVIAIDGDTITKLEDGMEEEDATTIDKSDLLKWKRVDKVKKRKESPINEKQANAIKVIKSLPSKRIKSSYRVTQLSGPLKVQKTDVDMSPSLVMGNVIDYVAKNIFTGKKVSATDDLSMTDPTGAQILGKLGDYFIGETHLESVIKTITEIKNTLEDQGNIFMAGIIVADEEASVSGEIDLLMISPEGVVTVADFKTSMADFTTKYMSQIHNGVANSEYFATQGYIYGLMLAKQTGLKVSPETIIIGLPISYSENDNAFDSKVNKIREQLNYIHKFSSKDIYFDYIENGKPLSTVKKITEKYNTIINQTATGSTNRRQRQRDDKPLDGLDMTIADINIMAATNEQLREEVAHMSEMFGEEFVVKFVNEMNKYKYGEWLANGTIIYNNAIKGVGYHEGWHQFSQLFLTRNEKIKMYDSVRKQSIPYIDRFGNEMNTSDHTDLEIEEFLADEWAKYAQAQVNKTKYSYPGTTKGVVGLFKRLWDLIKRWFSSTKDPQSLFRNLYNGRFKRQERDVNNRIWGNLNASILDKNDEEILSHSRTNLYIQTASYFLGEILDESDLSFSWLKNNIKNKNITTKLFYKFVDLQSSIMDQLSTTSVKNIEEDDDSDRVWEVMNDEGELAARTVKQRNIPLPEVNMYISQVREIEKILGEDNGAFDNFYDYYIKNSDVDSIRQDSDKLLEFDNPLDTEEVSQILKEEGEQLDQESDPENEVERAFKEGPNDKNPFVKASKEIQDFFKTMPIVKNIENGEYVYMVNELGVPLTYDYASIFNITKDILSGKDSIEAIMKRLSNKHTQKTFPQSKFIHDKLQKYIDKPNPSNVSFIRRFVNIMGMPEVDNLKLTVNLDALLNKNDGREKTLVKLRSQSRTGQITDINAWQYAFNLPTEIRPGTKITDETSPKDIFNNNNVSNVIYNIDGQLKLNPFYDYELLEEGMDSRTFLPLMGIELNEEFWNNSFSIEFADRVKSLMLKNLKMYKSYIDSLLASTQTSSTFTVDNLEELKMSPEADRKFAEVATQYFIDNPIQYFRERKTYSVGVGKKTKKIDTISIHPALEDLSRQNSIYSLNAPSRQFTDGGGKTKWPYYEPSLITRRTELLNNVANIREFNDSIEFMSLNPNTCPWIKTSLFYKLMFNNGKRATVAGKLSQLDGTDETVKIEVADLSSYETIQENVYTRTHPKDLSAQDKLFFDIVTTIIDGRIEVPRAATSSSIFSIKLNSYGVRGKGDSIVSEHLPIKITSAVAYRSDRFRVIMSNYLVGELQKLKWYFTKNPNAEVFVDKKGKKLGIDAIERNYYAHNLNVFKDILSPELASSLIKQAQDAANYEDIVDIVNNNKEVFHQNLDSYFVTYVSELMKGDKNASIEKMSSSQRKVLKNILSLYNDKSKSVDEADINRERRIADAQEVAGGKSSYQTAREAARGKVDSGLNIIASVFAVNQFILNVEYHNWYMGDNYLFSNPFKRGNLTTNTGPTAVVSPFLNSVLNRRDESMHSLYTGNIASKKFDELKTSVIKEVVTSSKYFDNIVNDIINWEKSHNPSLNVAERRAQLEEDYKAYKEMKAADGQAKIGLDAYRNLRIIFGNWEDDHEKEYRRQLAILRSRKNLYFERGSRKPLKKGALAEAKERDMKLISEGPYSFFNPQKFAYTGPELVKDKSGNNISSPMRTKFDKMSLQPLMPEYLAGSGHADEKLMDEMAINDIDYVKFESAAKGVKHESLVQFFNEDGTVRDSSLRLEDYDAEYLLSSYLKNQLSTEGMKDENTFGSQQRVMFFDVIYQKEVQNDPKSLSELTVLQNRYLNAIKGIMNYQRTQFFNRFGMEETGSGDTYMVDIVDEERFAAAISSLAKSNNFPDNMRDYLKYDKNTGQYHYDPSLVFNRKMLIDNIGGLIDSDLRRLKTKGVSAINVTSIGNTSYNITKPTLAQIKEFGTNGLHYYHMQYDEKGLPVRVSTMGIKITLQGDFRNLLNLKYKGEVIKTLDKLNEAIKDKVFKKEHMDKLSFIGYRIPTNDNNFIEHVEVMEFLPESSGNIIIAPPEHLIKSGSDFDVDKTNFVFPSINNKGELAALPGRDIKTIYDELNKITSSIRDYGQEQRDIRNALKRGEAGMAELEKLWRKKETALRNDFLNIDENKYWGMENSDQYSFYQIIDAFKEQLIDYEDSQKDLDTYLKLDRILKDNKWKTSLKVDENFNKLSKELQAFKDFHTNDMLKAMKEAISHPAYFRILVSPSSADYLVKEAEIVGRLTNRTIKDGSSSSENTKQTTVNTTGEHFLGANIGPYSIQRRWFSLLNFSEMKLNRVWEYSSKAHPMRIITPLASLDEREVIATDDSIMMYGDNVDGISPRKVWDMFMTLTIDLPSNTSYTLFGINNINKKVTQYLLASRYSVKKVMSFINQPVLQQVYNLYNKRSKELKDYTIKSALIEVSKSYGIKGQGFEDLQDKNLIKEGGNHVAADKYVTNPGVSATKLLNDDVTFSQEEMDEDIKNPNNTPEFKERQRNILLYFMVAQLEATNFTSMQFAFSEDRSKNTNYFTIVENDKKKEEIRGLDNDLPLDASMFNKQSMTKLEKKSIYAPFTYSEVAKTFYEKFAKEFTNSNSVTAIQRILNNTNVWGIDRQLLATRVEGDFIEFIYKNFASFDIDVYDPFTDTISRSKDSFGEYFLQNIFNINNAEDFKTYSGKFIKFMSRYPELANIPFVQKLYPEGIQSKSATNDSHHLDKLRASVMRFRRSQDNTVSERNHYANELENLMVFDPVGFKIRREYTEDDIKKISAFFTELAYLTLYQSGPTNIADNFSDLVPAMFWHQFSGKAFENYHKAIEDGVVTPKDLGKIFSMLYTQNNPKVPWKSQKMMYSLTYYGENLAKEKKKSIYSNKNIWKNTQFFLNFRAGKMYDMKRFAKFIKFTGIGDIKC